jgi:hypothetical protein
VEHYYPENFPSFWSNLTALASDSRLQSVSEVLKELVHQHTREFLAKWVNARKALFPTPDSTETKFVGKIFAVPAFQALVAQKKRLKGSPVADPWVIARAACIGGTLVAEESRDTTKIRIPKVCSHFNVPCVSMQGLMAKEGWHF